MPVYTYRCENCGHQFDKQQSFSDDPLKVCPECHKHTLLKVYQPAGVVFKGPGFYATDKRSGRTSSRTSSNGSSNGTSEGSESKKSESKPEKKEKTAKSED